MGKKSKRRNNKKTTAAKPAAPAPVAAVQEPTPAPVVPVQEPTPAPVAVPEPVTVTQTTEETREESPLPESLVDNLSLLTESQVDLAKTLCANGQAHIFAAWNTASDDAKLASISQLERMDKAYPSGGLAGYISNAKALLENSRKGVNPLEGWKPSVPQGENVSIGTKEFDALEQKGLSEIGKCGFVLVAGGLGERLGYGGIKLGLPTELTTETTYLQYYIETILAIQSRYAAPGVKLPLCIMVSNDTNKGTIELLEANDYFGMEKEQITIVQQGDGVPALSDNDATIAMDSKDPCKIQAKPHGHGDIHALLHSNHVALKWLKKGLEWVIFFQDTNGLAFHTLAVALGVSKSRDLVMNSIAVPRKGKQAVGGIAKLVNTSGEERTINVEYNQLDPLLRASGYLDGDVNDPTTGFSPFPGNINQLLFNLKPYAEALLRTNGAMPEFVNPKYADEAKTIFKKPTRLECMMQDFPTVLTGDAAKQVGFTSINADLCFSPVKNATSDGVGLQAKGTAAGVAATGEADQYAAVRIIMSSIGCQVEESDEATFSGIKVIPGPQIVTKPSFTVAPAEYKQRFPNPSKIKISKNSTLVVSGNVVLESLTLDGALVIECEEGASGTITDLVVNNKGWEKITNVSDDSPEYIRIRGYKLNKIETKKVIFKKDGTTEGYEPKVAKIEEPAPVEPEPVEEKKEEPVEATPAAKEASVEATPRKAPITSLPAESPALSKSLAVDVKSVPAKQLDVSRPNTPDNVAKSAECCIIS